MEPTCEMGRDRLWLKVWIGRGVNVWGMREGTTVSAELADRLFGSG